MESDLVWGTLIMLSSHRDRIATEDWDTLERTLGARVRKPACAGAGWRAHAAVNASSNGPPPPLSAVEVAAHPLVAYARSVAQSP